jgi:hypothetical protein
MRKHPYYWTDELLHQELITICAGTGRFPSVSELAALNRGDISNQIVRRGGFVKWAKRIGYARKSSDSDYGWEGERRAIALLEKESFKVEKAKELRSPFDLLVNDVLRVDVKAAQFASYGPCSGWFYRIGKTPQSDVVMLYQMDTGAAYYLPWYVCPKTNITISKDGGVYSSFKDNTSILRGMILVRISEQGEFSKLKAKIAAMKHETQR